MRSKHPPTGTQASVEPPCGTAGSLCAGSWEPRSAFDHLAGFGELGERRADGPWTARARSSSALATSPAVIAPSRDSALSTLVLVAPRAVRARELILREPRPALAATGPLAPALSALGPGAASSSIAEQPAHAQAIGRDQPQHRPTDRFRVRSNSPRRHKHSATPCRHRKHAWLSIHPTREAHQRPTGTTARQPPLHTGRAALTR